MDEVKILTSGSYYMTPFNKYHILEMLPRLHSKTEKELLNLGYSSSLEALLDLEKDSEVYTVRTKAGK